jgi:hypothetical protein
MQASLQTEVEQLLQQMGNTADEVAEHLRKANVRGIRNAVRQLNPVVRHVQVRVRSEAVEFDVMKGDVLTITYRSDRRDKEEVVIPDPVWQFLFSFNRGRYPDLELAPEEC